MTSDSPVIDSNMDITTHDSGNLKSNENVLEARAFLRERFIRAMLAMNGKVAEFHMYENTNVSAVFGSCDREFVNIYVKELQTPLGLISNALLRTNDIESIRINDINPSV